MNIKLTSKEKIKILNSDDVFEIMQRVLQRENKIDREKEHFWIIGLAQNNKILFIELVSIGSVKSTVVEPMNVFRVAVLKGAINVILVHNHPSGDPAHSENDMDLTDRLMQVGRILAIEVIDHLIITLNSYLSFDEAGLLEELRLSTKWVPSFEIIERIREQERIIREQAVKAAKEKGRKEGKEQGRLEMAEAMKKYGESVEKIKKYTRLSKKEIERL